MLPSQYPEVGEHKHLKMLLEIQVDMQFADAKTMLQLPASAELDAGCNLALANLLFALISGASVMFYRADLAYFKKYGAAGKRFMAVLREHYPWQPDDALASAEAAKLLYKFARNPLTHSFGVGKAAELFPGAPQAGEQAVWLAKGPLDVQKAEEVMRGDTPRPPGLAPTIRAGQGGIELSVVSLAWGTAAMCRSLFANEEEVEAAELLALRFFGR
jgi:hypothetical protein